MAKITKLKKFEIGQEVIEKTIKQFSLGGVTGTLNILSKNDGEKNICNGFIFEADINSHYNYIDIFNEFKTAFEHVYGINFIKSHSINKTYSFKVDERYDVDLINDETLNNNTLILKIKDNLLGNELKNKRILSREEDF